MNNRIKDMLNEIEVPDNLKDNLKDIQEGSKKKTGGTKGLLKVAGIFGVVALLGTGGVYAGRQKLRIDDFNDDLPSEASEYVNEEITVQLVDESTENSEELSFEEGQTVDLLDGIVSFEVKETLCDKYGCYIIIEATLTDTENYALVTSDETFCSDSKPGETIEEYSKRTGKKIISISYMPADPENKDYSYNVSYTPKREDDQHIAFYYTLGANGRNDTGFTEGEVIRIREVYQVYDPNAENEAEANYLGRDRCFDVTIEKVADFTETAEYALPEGQEMRVGDSTVTIHKITLINSAFSTRAEIELTQTDETVGNWMSINIVDDNLDFLEYGPIGGGESSKPDEEGRFKDVEDYKKMELPDHINVRIKYLDSNETFYLTDIPRVDTE